MDPMGWLILSLVLAVQAAIIISLIAGFFWWRYRKTSTSLISLAAEKEHLVQQRDAYLRFLEQHLRELGTGRRRGQKEDPQQALARRILETEKRHTLAARDRHLDIWDLRKESTRGLIDLLQGAPEGAIPESPQSGLAKTASEGELRRQLADREKTIERQREQIALLHPLRDTWVRLHGRARRESAANATFRDQINAIIQDPDDRLALETALEAYAPLRDALDDYLQVTAAAYEDAEPQQRRLAQRRLSRMQTVINRSAARMTDAVGGMPALLKDHRNVITQLETKLKQVRDAREIQKLN
ncbi:MAG: hypothetical protein JJT90_16530 [Ectothiorhodospiraceae bacterium]|nr:hypothetical protein [Ectothiorhodospiraceae bacterium]